MALLVDTSVWSLAFRRDSAPDIAEVAQLRSALEGGDMVVTTGLILEELLQGFDRPRARRDLLNRFGAIPLLAPDRKDHVDAAGLRNSCRKAGVQPGTIDALLAQIAIRHKLTMLSTDADFELASRHCPLRVWKNRR
jgi:predicted nucleic acid-binding protein